MSAANRGERGGFGRDLCPTPRQCARVTVALLEIRPGDRVLEPSAGTGNFVRAIREVHGVQPNACELSPTHREHLRSLTTGRVMIGNFLHMGRKAEHRNYDWIVGNPPFLPAEEHIRHAMYLLRPGGRLAFVLRAGLLHPNLRRSLRRDFPPWREYGMEERPPSNSSSRARPGPTRPSTRPLCGSGATPATPSVGTTAGMTPYSRVPT